MIVFAVVLALLGLAQLWAAQTAERNRRTLAQAPPTEDSYGARVSAGYIDAKGRLVWPLRVTGAAFLVAALVTAITG